MRRPKMRSMDFRFYPESNGSYISGMDDDLMAIVIRHAIEDYTRKKILGLDKEI